LIIMAIANDKRPLLLGGRWVASHTWQTRAGHGHPVEIAQASGEHVQGAVAAAKTALESPVPAHERAAILDRAGQHLVGRREEFAQLISAEVAKPISLARAEVDRAIGTLAFSAAEARTLTGQAVPIDAAPNGAGKLAFTQRIPRGILGAITPFNFPLNLVAHKLAPALAAGCPVVLKPAPQSPLTALALARALTDAGLPTGWLSVLPGAAEEVGSAIVEHPDIPVISFTGSVRVGWQLADRAPRKKILLELGGSAPAIVTADADIDLAAARIATNAFSYAGQSCVSVQRVYVDDTVKDEFLDKLRHEVSRVGVGEPSDTGVICGQVIDQAAADRLAAWIAEAQAQGAKLLSGGEITGCLITPTVLLDVPHDARLIQQEAFGPVLSVNGYFSLEEAFQLANATRFSLQAAVFTASLDTAMRAAHELRFGAVLINEAPTFRADQMPYGGAGDSGNTREGPHAVVRELTEERLVIIDIPTNHAAR
jgi:acyl-CoA reductase-like NAD-dependent aldehyde dehydrogenase